MNKALLTDGDEKKKGNNKFVYGTAVVLGCLFSLGLLIGGGFEKADTVTYLWENPRQCAVKKRMMIGPFHISECTGKRLHSIPGDRSGKQKNHIGNPLCFLLHFC